MTEEKLGKTIGIVLCVILSFALPYGILAFSTLESDPLEWTGFTRLLFTLAVLYGLKRVIDVALDD